MSATAIVVAIVVATLLELASYAVFVRDIRAGQARPSRTSWLIWAPLAWLCLAGTWSAGADATLAKLAVSALGVTAIAALSLRWGSGGRGRGDLACMALMVLGVVLWWRTDDPVLALALFLGADLAGAVPTLRHAWLRPDEESLGGWSVTLVASAINLALVHPAHWQPTAAGFGVWGIVTYLALFNLALVLLLIRPRLRVPSRATAPALL